MPDAPDDVTDELAASDDARVNSDDAAVGVQSRRLVTCASNGGSIGMRGARDDL